MKVPSRSHEERMQACGESWGWDGQASMNKQRNSADCEYWQRLREHRRCGAIDFHT